MTNIVHQQIDQNWKKLDDFFYLLLFITLDFCKQLQYAVKECKLSLLSVKYCRQCL
jgi:hypothetical protein